MAYFFGPPVSMLLCLRFDWMDRSKDIKVFFNSLNKIYSINNNKKIDYKTHEAKK